MGIDIGQRLIPVIRQVVDPTRQDQLTATSLLFEEQFLNSFGILQLVTALENEFGIQIQTEDLTFQNFGGVPEVAALVDRCLAAKPGEPG